MLHEDILKPMETEEEIDQLRQINEALWEKAELLQQRNHQLQETVDVAQETISLQKQLIDRLQETITLLEQKVEALELLKGENSFNSHLSPSSSRFSMPPKKMLKKSNKKRR